MTCLEKLKKDHPDYDEATIETIVADQCPDELGYDIETPEFCDPFTDACKRCWEREYQACTSNTDILDSGDRTQFESGAVRDMREGKGRFDVMPLEVIAKYICERMNDGDSDAFIGNLNMFLVTNYTAYLYSAMNIFDVMQWDNAYTMMLDVAVHYEQGAKKYGPSNWRKSIPTWCYIDSALRHYIKWRRGDQDEAHHRAIIWNLMCCIWEVDHGDTWRARAEHYNN